jgi:hypothetical protein
MGSKTLRLIAIWSQLLLPLFLLPQQRKQKKKFARQGKFFQPFSHFSRLPSTPDPEYKLKSANQTPTALSNALTNNHEISRNIIDERKAAYIKGVSRNRVLSLHAMSPC